MGVSRRAHQELIDGDIEWLLRQPRDLERDHIEAVLRKSVELLYGKEEQNMSDNVKYLWLACDKDGELVLFKEKPFRDDWYGLLE